MSPDFAPRPRRMNSALWLDEQVEPEPPGIDETVYGKPSGILGFRIFPNPDFNEEARKKWDDDRDLISFSTREKKVTATKVTPVALNCRTRTRRNCSNI
jgi:hypothetical protein